MKKRVFTVLVPIVLILLVAAVALGSILFEKFSYSKNRADLNEYFAIAQADEVAMVVQDSVVDEKAKMVDGMSYFTLSTVEQYFTDRFYVNSVEQVLLFTTDTDVIRINIGDGSNVMYVSEAGQELPYKAAFYEGDTLYIAADYVQKFANFEYHVYDEPLRMQVYTQWNSYTSMTVSKKTALRYQGGIKSDILMDLEKGDEVAVLEQMSQMGINPGGNPVFNGCAALFYKACILHPAHSSLSHRIDSDTDHKDAQNGSCLDQGERCADHFLRQSQNFPAPGGYIGMGVNQIDAQCQGRNGADAAAHGVAFDLHIQEGHKQADGHEIHRGGIIPEPVTDNGLDNSRQGKTLEQGDTGGDQKIAGQPSAAFAVGLIIQPEPGCGDVQHHKPGKSPAAAAVHAGKFGMNGYPDGADAEQTQVQQTVLLFVHGPDQNIQEGRNQIHTHVNGQKPVPAGEDGQEAAGKGSDGEIIQSCQHEDQLQGESVKRRFHPQLHQLVEPEPGFYHKITAEHNVDIHTDHAQAVGEAYVKVHSGAAVCRIFQDTAVIDGMEENDQQHGYNPQQIQIGGTGFLSHCFSNLLIRLVMGYRASLACISAIFAREVSRMAVPVASPAICTISAARE